MTREPDNITIDDLRETTRIGHSIALRQLVSEGGAAPSITFARGEELRATAFCAGNTYPQSGFCAADLLASPLQADSITMTSDTYVVVKGLDDESFDRMINPMTGERWAAGEMAMYYEAGNLNDLVTEQLTSVMIHKDGTAEQLATTYKRTKRDGQSDLIEPGDVHCLASRAGDDVYGLSGRVPDALHHALSDDSSIGTVLPDGGMASLSDVDRVSVECTAIATALAAGAITAILYGSSESEECSKIAGRLLDSDVLSRTFDNPGARMLITMLKKKYWL